MPAGPVVALRLAVRSTAIDGRAQGNDRPVGGVYGWESFGDGGEVKVAAAELGCPSGERRPELALADEPLQRHRPQESIRLVKLGSDRGDRPPGGLVVLAGDHHRMAELVAAGLPGRRRQQRVAPQLVGGRPGQPVTSAAAEPSQPVGRAVLVATGGIPGWAERLGVLGLYAEEALAACGGGGEQERVERGAVAEHGLGGWWGMLHQHLLDRDDVDCQHGAERLGRG
jgi:hypothetical protein